jgi:hypothetical protein
MAAVVGLALAPAFEQRSRRYETYEHKWAGVTVGED